MNEAEKRAFQYAVRCTLLRNLADRYAGEAGLAWLRCEEAQKDRTRLTAKVSEIEQENTKLRGILARSKEPCIYCGLTNMAECPSGFPGCGRMDDLMAADDFDSILQAHLERESK